MAAVPSSHELARGNLVMHLTTFTAVKESVTFFIFSLFDRPVHARWHRLCGNKTPQTSASPFTLINEYKVFRRYGISSGVWLKCRTYSFGTFKCSILGPFSANNSLKKNIFWQIVPRTVSGACCTTNQYSCCCYLIQENQSVPVSLCVTHGGI